MDPIVTYKAGSQTYSANLKELQQKNCNTQVLRSLRPPAWNVVPQAMRCRADIPSFRKALSADVMGKIAKAKTDANSVEQCLRTYAAAHGLPVGILDLFTQKIPQFGLALSVVWVYTVEEWVYKRVNGALRAEEVLVIAQLAPYISALGAACQQLKSDFSCLRQSHLPTALYRRLPLHPPELKQYQVGETFVWNSFTSTSCFPPAASEFGSTLFEIEFNQTALAATLFVEPHTAQPGEYEVLIPVGAFFEVVENTNNTIKV
eukprot:TRINITY_DN66747_c1_g3_i1.p2 TRINITY_DN66747_c1_g3~~TRINITY_DN66747_c1_g3_i1.p2  ORF type:complete len:261 (-),score=29.04 TRINITY_DN66747_c1_g3_i1:2035-2817(-)